MPTVRARMLALLLGLGISPAQADKSSSSEWIGQRVDLWRKTCLATAPDFARFETVLKANGFAPNPDGSFSFGKAEIVASRSTRSDACSCKFSFGTSEPAKAATQVLQTLLKSGRGTFAPDDDPESVGVLTMPIGKASVSVMRYEYANAPWVGIIMYGNRPCGPQNLRLDTFR